MLLLWTFHDLCLVAGICVQCLQVRLQEGKEMSQVFFFPPCNTLVFERFCQDTIVINMSLCEEILNPKDRRMVYRET